MAIKNLKVVQKSLTFIISLIIGWWFVDSGLLRLVVDNILPLSFVAEVMAGVFYTSFLTAPISVAMLVVIAADHNPILVALLAGVGAMLGDLVLVRFFRDKKVSDIVIVSSTIQKFEQVLKTFRLDFLIPLLGAVIIASPLPDELGLMLLGVSKLKYSELVLLTYTLNTAGILLIVLPANLLQ